tara:strand:- start:648 stop:833 length:186 start_codon:yes stop_codon:yes gene_type:complete
MNNTISKILALIMLIGGTYLCNQTLYNLLDNSGALDILVFAISIIMLRTGIHAIVKGKISC